MHKGLLRYIKFFIHTSIQSEFKLFWQGCRSVPVFIIYGFGFMSGISITIRISDSDAHIAGLSKIIANVLSFSPQKVKKMSSTADDVNRLFS